MTLAVEEPDKLNRSEIAVAVIALLFLLIARPLLAESSTNSVVSPSSTKIPSYLAPLESVPPTDSQAQREANAYQNDGTTLNPQAMPECRIDDSNCIEQRNRLNPMDPESAPTFSR